jgi:hypothetical protein
MLHEKLIAIKQKGRLGHVAAQRGERVHSLV